VGGRPREAGAGGAGTARRPEGVRLRVRVPGARLPGAGSATAARTPFVVLVVTLLAGGLISLLLLNSAVNQDSFELNKLQKETTGYTDEQQQLQQEVDGYSAPGSLADRARRLGMVPGGDPAFLKPSGGVQGSPSPATRPPAPPSPSATAPSSSPSPSDTPSPGAVTSTPTSSASPR
jgi:hypothetical protein